TDKGKPCSGPAFSTHMKSVFYHLTGVSVNLHLLKSSFVTYCYGDSQCTDAMKDSLASALRHTRKQAQLTYDRRNSSEKKSLAVSLASELAENTIESLSAQPSDRNAGLDKGSWVALTVEGSTLANPNILLARIQNLMPGRRASLLWFKATAEKGLYGFHFDEASWIESLDALVPVQTDKGKPCSGPAFSTHMKSVFYHLTGVSVNLHLLKSSFVTYCYGDSQCTDAMKDSLASALRHTRKQAQLTYDRRNSSEKKSLAVSLASELAENTIESLSAQPSDRNAGLDKGSWVALTVEGSTLANPNILLARIQNLMPGRRASLLWFKATAEKGLYGFHFDEASWIESLDALVPVQVKEIKNSPGLYKLTTSL
ncbi:predicted protein, partial [Nematostella vectensis]